jgi:hypothetical protein
MAKLNRYLEAFKEPGNVLGLGALVAISAAMLNPFPLLIGMGLEAVYLLFIPDSKWYMARLDVRYDGEVMERRRRLKAEVWEQISWETGGRFEKLESVRDNVNDQTFKGKKWYREVLRQLDYLLEKFLLLAVKQGQFERYLGGIYNELNPSDVPPKIEDTKRKGGQQKAEPARVSLRTDENVRAAVGEVQGKYDDEINGLYKQSEVEQNLHNQAVFEKRREVLTRRKEYVGRIGESLINIRHQLDLISDTFGLINDELRALSPEQVLADIEDVVSKTDTLSEHLQDISPFDTVELAAGAEKLFER